VGGLVKQLFLQRLLLPKKRAFRKEYLKKKLHKQSLPFHEHANLAHASHGLAPCTWGHTRHQHSCTKLGMVPGAGPATGRWGWVANQRTGRSDCQRKNCSSSTTARPTGSCPRRSFRRDDGLSLVQTLPLLTQVLEHPLCRDEQFGHDLL